MRAMKTGGIVFLLTCLALGLGARAGRAGQAPADEGYFTATLPLDAMTGKQAVMETTRGTIVLQLLPEHAPMHVAHFIAMAEAGEYEGTIFHTVVAQGIIQVSPFEAIDRPGVGRLLEMGTDLGREANPKLEVGICGEHGGEPTSVEFCHNAGLNYVSCSPLRVPIARLAAARAEIKNPR